MRLNALRLAALVVAVAPLGAVGGIRGVAHAVLIANAIAALRAVRLSARVVSGASAAALSPFASS